MVKGITGRGTYMNRDVNYMSLFLRGDIDYDTAVEYWKRSLSNTDVVGLATDYASGLIDESTKHAYEESLRRWPGKKPRPSNKNTGRKPNPRCEAHKTTESNRLPKGGCPDCLQLRAFAEEGITPSASKSPVDSEPIDAARDEHTAPNELPMTLADALALASIDA